jgi:hypothetical protein
MEPIMPHLRTRVATAEMDELARNATIVADKLRGKGVSVARSDTPEDLVSLLESVEAFEGAVRLAGGDLMMDEPPEGSEPQPDEPRFMLPKRLHGESASSYVMRIADATRMARGEVSPEN